MSIPRTALTLARRAALGAAATLALTSAAVALPAGPSAAANDHGTFHDEFEASFDCGDGLVLDFHNALDGRYVGVQRGDGFWYYLETWDRVQTVTNPDTGLSLTITNKGLAFKDQTIIDTGDTLVIRTLSPARLATYGPDGTLVAHASGLAVYRLIFAVNDPADPDDDEFQGVEVEKEVGHSAPALCDLAATYLT